MPEQKNKAKTIEVQCPVCAVVFSRRTWQKKIRCSRSCAGKVQTPRLGPHRKKPITQRFWPKVNQSPGQGPQGKCWEWQAGTMTGGYGLLGNRGTHKISWELHNGPIPDGMSVLHHCDNPPCVNPDHLFLGDHKDNALDMMVKGRHRNGKKSLAPEEVRSIRAQHSQGATTSQLAVKFKCHRRHVQKIIARRAWDFLQ